MDPRGLQVLPHFAAEHADISTGGIGALADWTLTVVRSELGQEVIDEMAAGGALEVRPGEDDPGALALMGRLSSVSRRRWPVSAAPGPRLGVPPPKVPGAVTTTATATGRPAPPPYDPVPPPL